MRLDAVYVLAPRSAPPSMSTRRAFLFAGCTFAAGIAVGGACGYSAGIAATSGSGDGGGSDPLPSSGDAELDELRRLAVKAPIDELMAQWRLVLTSTAGVYPKDPVLWRGVDRLCDAVLAGPIAEGKVIAVFLRQMIEQGDASMTASRAHRVEALRRVR